MTALEQLGRRAKQAEQFLRTASTASKDHGLTQIADALLEHTAAILEANAKDIANGEQAGMSPALLDRLRLNEARIAGMAQGMPRDCCSAGPGWQSALRREQAERLADCESGGASRRCGSDF